MFIFLNISFYKVFPICEPNAIFEFSYRVASLRKFIYLLKKRFFLVFPWVWLQQNQILWKEKNVSFGRKIGQNILPM